MLDSILYYISWRHGLFPHPQYSFCINGEIYLFVPKFSLPCQSVLTILSADPEGISNAQKSLGLGQEEKVRQVR